MSRWGTSAHLGTSCSQVLGQHPKGSVDSRYWLEGSYLGRGAPKARKLTVSCSLLAEKLSAIFRKYGCSFYAEVFLSGFVVGEYFCSTRVTKESVTSCLCNMYGCFSLYGSLFKRFPLYIQGGPDQMTTFEMAAIHSILEILE